MSDEISDKLLAMLNEAAASDSAAMQELMDQRVECGKALATHPTIQVVFMQDDMGQRSAYYLGVMGLINGFLNKIGNQSISPTYDENDSLKGFVKVDTYEGEV